MNIKVEKALGEPVAADFSDYVRKIRANLIFVSVVAITISLGGLELDASSTIFGLKFKGLDDLKIVYGFLFLNGYMLFHFLWCSFDAFQEWGLRVSGTRVAFVTTARFSADEADYPSDPRQSTLYNWWKDEAKKIGTFTGHFDEINKKLENWESKIKTVLDDQGNSNTVNACASINAVISDISQLKTAIEKTSSTIESARIPVSLERFDNRFQLFLRSQNLRWLIIELTLPIVLGSYSIVLLIGKL